MREFKLTVELSFCGFSNGENTEIFEVEDNATEEEIEEEARETFLNMCSYSFSETSEGGEE